MIENVTVQERFDETTSKSSYIILEHKSEKYQPAISIVDKDGEEIAQLLFTSWFIFECCR